MPPLVVCFPRSVMAFTKPRAPVPSTVFSPPETTAPAHPPTPDRIRNVLFAVRSLVADRLADDPGPDFELPEQVAVARVERLEPAVHGSVEDDVAGRDHSAAPGREHSL